MYAFPQNACSWWGLGTVGGNPSRSWINGSLQLRVVAHEMGHNFGLWHSHARWSAARRSSAPAAPASSTGTRSTSWARQAVGFDGFLAGNGNVLNGVVLHTGSESSGDTSYLLDLTPATSSWNDPALVVGQSFSDPDAGVTITAVSSDGTSAAVSVSFAPVPCVPASPTVALSPSQSQWVRAGTPVTYTVSVTNRDNASCPPATFALGASVPSGWGATFGSAALSIDPGATGSTSLIVTSSAGTAEGFYTVGATATSTTPPNLGGSASGTYVVVNDLDVTVATNKPTYPRNQTVTITATVANATSPVAGASVTFTVTKPNGSVVTSTGTTGPGGTATYRLRLKKNDPTGLWRVDATATVNGAISGTGTASFNVQ